MWSSVTGTDINSTDPAPTSRCKHSATLLHGNLYLLGGRCGNVPLKDFWKFNLAEGKWTQLQAGGEKPPCLQEHSAVGYKDQIYVFGGEVGFSSGAETPLWVYSISRDSWRKVRTRRGVQVPRARRGHTALIHRGAMLIYGGYQDLRGSCADLWAFHFETESWHLLSGPGTGGEVPPARHRHSAVLHDDCMWIYGGMTDLVARGDLWRWDTRTRCWFSVRCGGSRAGPGARHGHSAAAAHAYMLLLGGDGDQTQEMQDSTPVPETLEDVLIALSEKPIWRFAFHTESWEKVETRGEKPSVKSDGVALTVSDLHLHQNNTNVLIENNMLNIRPRTSRSGTRCNNKITPCDVASATNNTSATTYIFPNNATTTSSFISRLTALRSTACQYTVLHADSTESLLSSNATPQRLPKSKSAYNHSSVASSNITRDPISVPNFTHLNVGSADKTSAANAVNAAKNGTSNANNPATGQLVRLEDTDEEDSGVIHVKPADNSAAGKKIVIYENLGVARGESYSSHLGRVDSTSDYASLSLDMSHSSSSGFCNPNYVAAAALLGTTGAADESKCAANLELELQSVNKCRRRVGRAASASRAETRSAACSAPCANTSPPLLYVFLVGGKEPQVTVCKRPVSIWKLQLY